MTKAMTRAGACACALLVALGALGVSGCGTRSFPWLATRPVRLVSEDRSADAALAAARRYLALGDAERAAALLRALRERAPRDPVEPLARVLLARAELALGRVMAAGALLDSLPAHDARARGALDPTVRTSHTLVRGLLEARAGEHERALERLGPLESTLPDRGDTADLSCALAVSASDRDPPRALRALVTLDALVARGVAWPAALPACDGAEPRAELLRSVLERVESPASLAAALDELPVDSAFRRLIALRLRTVAERVRELPRWLRWLADLPDDRGSDVSVTAEQGPIELVVGVVGPLQGARASLGVALLRGAQLALERVSRVRVVPVDEGDSPAAVAAAIEGLAAQGARVVIGVSREDLAAAAAITAQARSVDLWLTAPVDDVIGTGPRVHSAGPPLSNRVQALGLAARHAGPRAVIVTRDESSEGNELRDGVRALLSDEGLLVMLETPAEALRNPTLRGAARGPRTSALVLSGLDREARASLGARAVLAPERWIFDARGGVPGGAGTWVGVRSTPATEAFVTRYCTIAGEPPDETVLLAHDAAREALRTLRHLADDAPELPPRVLDADGVFASFTRAEGDARPLPPDAPAAAARCPRAD